MEKQYENFVNLHTHSDIGSPLDGYSTVEEIFKRASELNQRAIAITDHGSTAALPYMIKYGEKYNVKPIMGCEFYIILDDGSDPLVGKRGEIRLHFMAIARNWNGCKSIFKKLSLANKQYFNGRPRLFLSQLYDFEDCFISFACAISMLTFDHYEELTKRFHKIYGNYFYLELIHASFKMKDRRPKKEQKENPIEQPDQAKLVNLRCVEMHKKLGIPLVATSDSHFTYPEQAEAFEVMLAIQTRAKMTEPTFDQGGRRFFFGEGNIFIKGMMGIYNDLKSLGYLDDDIIKKAIKNTVIVSDKCKINMPEFSLNLPKPYEGDDDQILKKKVKEGFYKLGLDKKPNKQEYMDRIVLEVKAIKKVGFTRYFLIMTDILDYCRKEGIPVGSCRGCYSKDAQVWTTDGYKSISDVKVGDHVINEDGVIDQVNNTFKYRIKEEMYEIDYMFGSNKFCPKVCTGDHKQLVHKNDVIDWKRTDNIDETYDMCIPKLKPIGNKINTIDLNDYNTFGYDFDDEFIYEVVRTNKPYKFSIENIRKEYGISENCIRSFIKDGSKTRLSTVDKIFKITGMTRNDYIEYINKNSKVIKKTNRFIKVDKNLNKVIGLLVGDGWCSNSGGRGAIGLAINNETAKDRYNRKDFENFYNKFFDTDEFYYENISKTKKLSQLYINSHLLSAFFENDVLLYDKNGFKYFNRKWLEQEKDFIEEIYNGMLMPDGYFRRKSNIVHFDNTSMHLIGSMVELSMRLGKIPVINKRGKSISGGYECKESYKVTIYDNFTKKGNNKIKTGSYNLRPGNDEYFFAKVNSVKNIGAKEMVVYDLSISNKQSFMINNYITHNSGGASIVLLCLGVIRRIDAIKYDLMFSRFINIERVSFPDIDSDFGSIDRHKVIEYLSEKYGNENVCGISTYTYLSAKNAFRDVCSAYGFSSTEINKLSKMVEEGELREDGKIVGKYSRIESFDHVPELKEFKEKNRKLFNIIKDLDGRIRGAGQHAAGIICSSIPINDFGPVMYRKGGYCVAYDKKTSEDMFCMLKLDALGLKTVDVASKACDLISKKIGKLFTTDDIPLDDKETEEMIANGDTVAVFQFEGPNARRSLKECKSGTLLTCAGISSAIRPGVIAAKDENGVSATKHYIDRLSGSEQPSYYIPQFEEILGETKGELLFQEQVMKTCSVVAGFSESESDTMRRLIGKKATREQFEELREKFVTGCTSHSGIETEKSNHIFDNFVESSSYLFNKSHAVGYAILSMESAWLKRHHPVEFYCGVLSCAGKDDKFQEYIRDAKRHNVEVCYPDINISDPINFIIYGGKIMAPLNSIKGVGDIAANHIKDARESTTLKSFRDYNHFLNVLTGLKLNGKVNIRVKSILYKANVFKSVGYFVENMQERRGNLRDLLALFSPIPSINFKSGRQRDKEKYESLIKSIKKCSNSSVNGSFVAPIIASRPSILVVLDLSKQDVKLLQGTNTQWMHNHLAVRLGISKSLIAFTSVMKCSFYNKNKIDINQECKTMCTREFLSREIEIIRPRVIINCVSWITGWMIDDGKAKFQETFGNVYYSGKFDSYVINMPSPQWISFSDDIKETHEKQIIPLLESLRCDQL